jgi:hypothetical protein
MSHQNACHCAGSRTATTPSHDGRQWFRKPSAANSLIWSDLICNGQVTNTSRPIRSMNRAGRRGIGAWSSRTQNWPQTHSSIHQPSARLPLCGYSGSTLTRRQRDRSFFQHRWRCAPAQSPSRGHREGATSPKGCEPIIGHPRGIGHICGRGICRWMAPAEGLLCVGHRSPTSMPTPERSSAGATTMVPFDPNVRRMCD